MRFKSFIYSLILICTFSISAQTIEESIQSIIESIPHPQTMADFKPLFHFPPVNQDTTNICWSFSTVSFIETELQRLGKPTVKLSVIYPVYYTFIEKAKYFVQTKGTSRFKAGDLFTTVLDIIRMYGIVPESVYRGQGPFSPVYNHRLLERELAEYMTRVKQQEFWDERQVCAGVKTILDKHLGTPPVQFQFEHKIYTPLQFAETYVNLPWPEYLAVTSFLYAPFGQKIILDVPDNWRHLGCYINVPLNLFYTALRSALQRGYSVAIDGDISEPGRYGPANVCIIPEFDIPGQYIDQQSRELRFEQGTTTDDHLMHIIGYQLYHGQDWFLVKDSWRDAWQGKCKGYFFFSGDYVKLKVLAYLVHRDAIPEITQQVNH
jgi:bleomycin hydrolase